MFTGIIEEVGTIKSIASKGKSLVLTIGASQILEDVALGDSIAVNGVCLTVTKYTKDIFTADVMPETFNATNLRFLKNGSIANLERAMMANNRFGGHFVSGHVDGLGEIIRIIQNENAQLYQIKIPLAGCKYCYVKGSITIDGTSLTIFDVQNDIITVSLIPHTRANTVIGSKHIGNKVNVEFDLLGKHVERLLSFKGTDHKISSQFLADNGFL
ncbi:riboflavin synthase [Peribacillus alkalitolerans]|uniref:riboflavin synthase n=1 Tax=Peribacillus alkalitolerans TaxID=1550385 RepID=UPI0013D0A49F|nr:riboflavin synthase [Peribacillus alkalitolerans]